MYSVTNCCRLLEFEQQHALGHHIACGYMHPGHRPADRRTIGVVHLHGLEGQQYVSFLHPIPDFHVDGGYRTRNKRDDPPRIFRGPRLPILIFGGQGRRIAAVLGHQHVQLYRSFCLIHLRIFYCSLSRTVF